MIVLLLCAALCAVSVADDVVPPDKLPTAAVTHGLAQAVGSATKPLVMCSGRAPAVGGPDAFQLTIYLAPHRITGHRSLQAAKDYARGVVGKLPGAKIRKTKVSEFPICPEEVPAVAPPKPKAGEAPMCYDHPPGCRYEPWIWLDFTTLPVDMDQLEGLAKDFEQIAQHLQARKWKVVCKRERAVGATQAQMREAIECSQRMANATARAAGYQLGPLHAVAVRPRTTAQCFFEMGTKKKPGPVTSTSPGAKSAFSIGTRITVELWASWQIVQ